MDRTSPPWRVAVTLEQCWHRVPGGTARAAIETTRAIHATGLVELVGVAARHRNAPEPPWVPSIPVAMLAVPRPVLYETWHLLGWPAVERATGPVDAIHVTGLAMPPRTAPMVVTLHDLAFVRYPSYFTRHGLRFFHTALRRIRAHADLILCSSEATRRDASDAGLPEDRLRVVPLGVAPAKVTAGQIEAMRERFGLHGRYVLHLGTAEPRKNTAALIRAAGRLPDDVTVVLAGGSGWGPTAAGTIGARGRVRDLGFVSETDKWALLAGAAVFCYPSFWEGFGLPVAEAMAVGTPVVTSSGTSLEEVVGDAGMCVDPHDDDAITQALCRVLTDGALAAELAAAGRQRAGQLTWSATAEATIGAYREVIET